MMGWECAERIIKNVEKRLHNISQVLMKNDGIRISLQPEEALDNLAEAASQLELLVRDGRCELMEYHAELEAEGCFPNTVPLPKALEFQIDTSGNEIVITMPCILPLGTKGFVYYLHEGIDRSIQRIKAENSELPLFHEKSALVFEHHYNTASEQVRHLRDFDNLERKCITNVIARYFLLNDSPLSCIVTDILKEDSDNFTVARVMSLESFKAYILSENIT